MGKMWMVTGGTSGLGAEILGQLPTHAYRVGRTPLLMREDSSVRDICCDARQPDKAVADIISKLDKDGAALDVLINCAAINLIEHTDLLDAASIQSVLAVNAVFPLLLTAQLCAAGLFKPAAIVVNVGSDASRKAGAFSAAYVMSKHALTGVTRSLARDYGDRARVFQVNFSKLHGTKMSDLIDRRQAALRKTTVAEERDRQKGNWLGGREIPLREAAKYIITLVEDGGFYNIDNGAILSYGE